MEDEKVSKKRKNESTFSSFPLVSDGTTKTDILFTSGDQTLTTSFGLMQHVSPVLSTMVEIAQREKKALLDPTQVQLSMEHWNGLKLLFESVNFQAVFDDSILNATNVLEILKAAHYANFSLVINKCEQFILLHLHTMKNHWELFDLAWSYGLEILQKRLIEIGSFQDVGSATYLPKSAATLIQKLSELRRVACGGCGSLFHPSKLRDCGRCRITQYCSKGCQKENWKEHRLVCKIKRE